jgi:putative transposase
MMFRPSACDCRHAHPRLAKATTIGFSEIHPRVDQGSEFVSRDPDLRTYKRGVTLDFSRPDKPRDNAFIESLNGKFRTECLTAHWFMSLDDTRRKCENCGRHYNEERPHGAIGGKSPIALVSWSAANGPP